MSKPPPKPCFICDGPHWTRDCPSQKAINALVSEMSPRVEESPQEELGSIRRLGSLREMLSGSDTKEHGLLFTEMTINNQKTSGLIDTGATHNFLNTNELTFTVVSLDDYSVVLGLDFFEGARAFPIPATKILVILDNEVSQIINLKKRSEIKPLLSALQFKKATRKGGCYLAAIRELLDDEPTTTSEIPRVVKEVLDEFRDVMPTELPKKLPPRREVDHQIELIPGAKPPTMTPYRMAPPELMELKRKLKDLLDSGYIQP
ncbi:reverse transcriptase, partial [Tanacetum coccineum]